MINKYDFQKIGNRIKQERNNAKKSQDELGDYIGVTRQTVAKWEHGKDLPQLSDLLRLCNLFDCEIGYLLCEYDCKTKVATDIKKETGLTEKAISGLAVALSKNQVFARQAVNALLECDCMSALDVLGRYFSIDDKFEIIGNSGQIIKEKTLIAIEIQPALDVVRQYMQKKQSGGKS